MPKNAELNIVENFKKWFSFWLYVLRFMQCILLKKKQKSFMQCIYAHIWFVSFFFEKETHTREREMGCLFLFLKRLQNIFLDRYYIEFETYSICSMFIIFYCKIKIPLNFSLIWVKFERKSLNDNKI